MVERKHPTGIWIIQIADVSRSLSQHNDTASDVSEFWKEMLSGVLEGKWTRATLVDHCHPISRVQKYVCQSTVTKPCVRGSPSISDLYKILLLSREPCSYV